MKMVKKLLVGGAIICSFSFLSFNDVAKPQASYEPSYRAHELILCLRPDIDKEMAALIGRHIDLACLETGLDPELVVALIGRESSFIPWSVSSVGCKGLMQVHFKAHPDKTKGLKESDLFQIAINVRIGCMILKEYIDSSTTLYDALGKYVGSVTDPKKDYRNEILRNAAELYALKRSR